MSESVTSKPKLKPTSKVNLDEVLELQLSALEKLTQYIHGEIVAKKITKDTPTQLSTCMKMTMEISAKQKELLDKLSDEDLKDLNSDESP